MPILHFVDTKWSWYKFCSQKRNIGLGLQRMYFITQYTNSPSQTNTQSISLKNEESLFRDKRMINKKKEKKKKFSLSSYYVSDTVTLSLLMSLNFY